MDCFLSSSSEQQGFNHYYEGIVIDPTDPGKDQNRIQVRIQFRGMRRR